MPAQWVPTAGHCLRCEGRWASSPCRAITLINLERAQLDDEEDFMVTNCILQLKDG